MKFLHFKHSTFLITKRFLNMLDFILKLSLKVLIYAYRYTFSFWLGKQCRFDPSCSEYAITALSVYSAPKAILLITKRLLSCHPFNKNKDAIIYDPVKDK